MIMVFFDKEGKKHKPCPPAIFTTWPLQNYKCSQTNKMPISLYRQVSSACMAPTPFQGNPRAAISLLASLTDKGCTQMSHVLEKSPGLLLGSSNSCGMAVAGRSFLSLWMYTWRETEAKAFHELRNFSFPLSKNTVSPKKTSIPTPQFLL